MSVYLEKFALSAPLATTTPFHGRDYPRLATAVRFIMVGTQVGENAPDKDEQTDHGR